MSDTTRKRPDRSDAAKRRKTLDETVVKVSLPGILVAHDGQDAFREELERLVENISKSVNKGSLLLNRFLLKRLEANETLPDLSSLTLYVQCLNIGSGRLNKPTEGLQTAWDAHFSNFPKIEKLAGNAQALTYAARTFQTNFINSLVSAFDTRQKYLLKAWIVANDLPKESLQAIRFAINGMACSQDENCIYLDIQAQHRFFPKLSKLIPYNHYGRKNLGYLFAIKKGYDVIYETDDDNIPFDNFDDVLNFDKCVKTIQENDSKWINIFKHFTNNNWIWPRGYPLSLIKKHAIPNYTFENSGNQVSIVNGLVENEPDVDAVFRLTCNHQVTWEKNKKVIISNKNICVFNTQNTFWIDKTMFIGLLLPCSVTFRYCDILKGIIANVLLRFNDKNMAYTSPNVTQLRNEHDLMNDFQSEYSMHIGNEKIIPIIEHDIQNMKNNKELLYKIYRNLFENDIITQLDLDICQEWLSYF